MTSNTFWVCSTLSPQHAHYLEIKDPRLVKIALQKHNIDIIELPNHPEMKSKRAMNWVCMGPDHVVMPHGCQKIASILNDNGVKTDFLDVSEYIGAGGALGCLTGILERKFKPPKAQNQPEGWSLTIAIG